MRRATVQFGALLSGLIILGIALGPWIYDRYRTVIREANAADLELRLEHQRALIDSLGSVEAYLEYQRIISGAEQPDR